MADNNKTIIKGAEGLLYGSQESISYLKSYERSRSQTRTVRQPSLPRDRQLDPR